MNSGYELAERLEFQLRLRQILYTIIFCALVSALHEQTNAEDQHNQKSQYPPSGRVVVAIAKPVNRSGDTSLDLWCTVVQSLITVRLRELRAIRIVDDMDGAQMVLNSTNSVPVGDELAQKLGKLVGAQRVISSDLRRTGDKWSITARVLHTDDGRSSEPITVVSNDLLRIAQTLTVRIAGETGIHPNTQDEKRMRLRWDYSEAALGLLGKAFQLLAQQSSLEEIESYLRQVIKLQPEVADTYIPFAEVLRRQGKLAEAEHAALSAVNLWPESPSAHRRLGFVLCSQKRLFEAERELRTAERLDPDEGETHMALAYTCWGEGLPQEAVDEFKRAVRLNPYAYFAEDVKRRIAELEPLLPMARFSVKSPNDYTKATYSEALRQKLGAHDTKLVINPLLTNPNIENWARQLAATADSQEAKAKQLFAAFVRRTRNPLLRTPPTPRTATEAFDLWNAPQVSLYCQDLALLYTVSARAIGLKAYAVLVLEAHNGSKAWHSCAAVYLDGKAVLADPLYPGFGANHKRFVLLDDIEAAALYMCGLPDVDRRETACKLAPDIALVQLGLFDNLVILRRWSEARESLRKIRELDADGAIGDYAEAKLALSQNDAERTISLMRKAVAIDPEEGQFHTLLTEAYAQAGDFGAAFESCSNALKYPLPGETADLFHDFLLHTNRLAAFGLHKRGLAQSTKGDLSGALATLTEAIRLDPQMASTYADRGQIEGEMGDRAAAIADFDRAFSLSPDMAEDYHNWVTRTNRPSSGP
jgi:tetratricopeptide (TPR) repeat protein